MSGNGIRATGPLRFAVKSVGPIADAKMEFGDLTVLIGPQATGKSLALRLLRLALDAPYIRGQMEQYGLPWGPDVRSTFDRYLGSGMGQIWQNGISSFTVGVERAFRERLLLRVKSANVAVAPLVLDIPAQRVLSLESGWPKPFLGYSAGDPFCLRDFSELVRRLLEEEVFKKDGDRLFPQPNRLKEDYRKLISAHLFGKMELKIDSGLQRRLVLAAPNAAGIHFGGWSAGQREFVPLLMGLYWLMPAAKVARRGDVEWAIIEEPEMGLHPDAIQVLVLLCLELVKRGYRVAISTHSVQVLEVLWALRVAATTDAPKKDSAKTILRALGVEKPREDLREMMEVAIGADTRAYYFGRDGATRDISALDPAAENSIESGWGGLSGFSSRMNEAVAEIIDLAQVAGSPR